VWENYSRSWYALLKGWRPQTRTAGGKEREESGATWELGERGWLQVGRGEHIHRLSARRIPLQLTLLAVAEHVALRLAVTLLDGAREALKLALLLRVAVAVANWLRDTVAVAEAATLPVLVRVRVAGADGVSVAEREPVPLAAALRLFDGVGERTELEVTDALALAEAETLLLGVMAGLCNQKGEVMARSQSGSTRTLWTLQSTCARCDASVKTDCVRQKVWLRTGGASDGVAVIEAVTEAEGESDCRRRYPEHMIRHQSA